ncbi:Eco57I restriction-modification methylase domain-containing protein [Algoriphagus sp.]|uniref:Eco57I restriction-modification methylase domain-containing protein n=1 Tax=Algoriphagus sp. TaxID=1872435 RepID=UPI003F72F179
MADETNPFRAKLIDGEKETKDKAEKPIRDFVKKLLGRIVFLQFLEKKGWMGCDANSQDWTGGNPRFMYQLFEDFNKPEKFLSHCLTKLFFETLNTKRPNDVFEVKGLNGKLNGSRVPYLNGGLFEPEKNKATLEIDFPADFFKELLEFFDQYNFTIDENSPDDHEVGIDPEMLGHIFENLLEDNRDKGAFYTPKEIVQYMCKESLIQYLLNTFQEQKDIEAFIRFHSVSDLLAEKENALLLNQKLDDIKVCDPAIGSGAFPIGMLQEIFEAKRFIYPYLKTNKDFKPAEVKKNIIQNSIYGVDLEKGAVDIAQLRFWLSLVVEELNPHPLPNLDYKIMQGNSLLEQYEGIELGNAALFNEPEVKFYQASMFEEPNSDYGLSKEKQADIKSLIDDYFKVEDKAEKTAIHKRIDSIVIDHIDKSLEFFENKLLIEVATYEKQLDKKLERLSENQRQQFLGKSKELKEIVNKKKQLESRSAERKRLLEFENTDERPYFLWHLYFSDVFDPSTGSGGGFDVMIGNPPYVQLQKIRQQADILSNAGFETFTRTGDIYCLFYEKGVEYLKEDGVLSYITSNSWMRAKYGKSLRQFFAGNTNPLKLLNFENTLIFKSATVETNILVLQKKSFEKDLKAVAILDDLSRSSLHDYLSNHHIKLDDLPIEGWSVSSKEDFDIKLIIENSNPTIKELGYKINRGILTGFNEAFIIDSIKAEELLQKDSRNSEIIKKFIGGRNISKYVIEWDNLWLINTHNGLKIDGIAPTNVGGNYPVIFDHLRQYEEKLVKRTDQGDHWTNLRDCSYIYDFEKPKLIWAELSDLPKFVFDNEAYYTNKTTFIMTGEKLKFLAGVLNSKVLVWYFAQISTSTGMGTTMWSKYKVEQIPVKIPDLKTELKFEVLVDYILFIKKQEDSIFESISNETVSKQFEDVIDQMAYELYFENHMKEQKIDVIKFIKFPDLNEAKSDIEKKALVQKLYYELTEKDNEIRNRMLLSFTRSPAIIKRINDTVVQ